MKQLSAKKNFAHLALASSGGNLAPATWLGFLSRPAAAQAIAAILAERWGIAAEDHAPLIERFTAKLQKVRVLPESSEVFAKLTASPEAQARLSRFVLEEFATQTNYLAFAIGRELKLKLV